MCHGGGGGDFSIKDYFDFRSKPISIERITNIPKPEPLELKKLVVVYNSACNLDCALCFTQHDKMGSGRTIDNTVLLPFLEGFLKIVSNHWIVWEGKGEVLVAPDFYKAINWCADKFPSAQHTVITNGTILNALTKFNHPEKVNLSVSLDGLKETHEKNRGEGNFDKTVEFLRFASKMGFKSIYVRMIVTQENLYSLPEFKNYIAKISGDMKIYLQELVKPQKPCEYDKLYVPKDLIKCLANEKYGLIAEADFGPEGSKRFCLHPDGIYNCGNNIVKIGSFDEKPEVLLNNYLESKLKCDICPNNTCGNIIEK